jgi:hypothetical protein
MGGVRRNGADRVRAFFRVELARNGISRGTRYSQVEFGNEGKGFWVVARGDFTSGERVDEKNMKKVEKKY